MSDVPTEPITLPSPDETDPTVSPVPHDPNPGHVNTLALAETVMLDVDAIVPYPNNPRKITDRAVRAVAASIREYGYHQPIVVDRSNVVIVGHTRLEAVRLLGWTEVPVLVAADLTDEQANAYRLVDNRTGEMTDWDYDSLVAELREFEAGLLNDLFPEIDLEIQQIETAVGPTQGDIDDASEAIKNVTPPPPQLLTGVVCPSCGAEFKVRTDSLPGLSANDIEELRGATGG